MAFFRSVALGFVVILFFSQGVLSLDESTQTRELGKKKGYGGYGYGGYGYGRGYGYGGYGYGAPLVAAAPLMYPRVGGCYSVLCRRRLQAVEDGLAKKSVDAVNPAEESLSLSADDRELGKKGYGYYGRGYGGYGYGGYGYGGYGYGGGYGYRGFGYGAPLVATAPLMYPRVSGCYSVLCRRRLQAVEEALAKEDADMANPAEESLSLSADDRELGKKGYGYGGYGYGGYGYGGYGYGGYGYGGYGYGRYGYGGYGRGYGRCGWGGYGVMSGYGSFC